jgi:transposase-like protein
MADSTRILNRWTPTRKAVVILELLRGGDAVELARKHGLSQAQLFAGRPLNTAGLPPAKRPPFWARRSV